MKSIKLAVLVVITIFMLSTLTVFSQTADYSEPKVNILPKPEPDIQAEPNIYVEPQLTRSARVLENDFNVADAQLTFVGADSADRLGNSIAYGDIDNDGLDDLIMGAPIAGGPDTSSRTYAGEVLVTFGKADQPFPGTSKDLAITGYDMIIYGGEGYQNWQNTGDNLGTDLATGDFNGDGYDDIIMGAPNAELVDTPRRDAGAVFVTYGGPRSSLPPVIDLASGADFIIWGYYQESDTGRSVAAGDVDNDGYDDIIVGSPYADPNNRQDPGLVYVVYGSANPGTTEDLFWQNRDPDTLVIVGHRQRNGNDAGDQAGYSVASGDVNGDKFADIIIGAHTGQFNNGRVNAGAVYVILGSGTRGTIYNLQFDARVNIWGDDAWDYAGQNLESTDIDNDGLDDIIISAIYGDGLNNAKSNAGEVYIIYGSTSLAQDIQLNNGYDAIIYGRNVDDYLGEGLAVGNLNNDQYMDFAVSATYNDGDVFNIANGGVAYVFLGEDRTSAGTLYDTNTETVAEIYGRNQSDQLGFGMAMGDFDGDGMDDFAVSSRFADGPVSARDNCGEVYLIYGQGPPTKINGVEVLDSSGQPTDIVYSKYDDYTFRVNVTNVLGSLDLSEVVLTLDPNGEDIQYKFTYSPSVFALQKDTNSFTKLSSVPGDARKTGLYNWEIDFNLEFDWSYPSSGKLPCTVSAKGINSLESTKTFDDVFEVEDDLEFSGALEVYDEEGALLIDNDWVAGGETIAFTNIIPVYEGTTDFYPPTDEFEVTVSDSAGSWTNATDSGEPIYIEAILKTITDPNDPFTVAITSPATEAPRAQLLINLSIDGEMPEPPDDIEFRIDEFGNTPITAVNSTQFYMNWNDGTDAFSGIRGYYYSLINNGGTREGGYTTGHGAVISDAPEGLTKVYLWAIDNAGNVGLASSSSIFVDLDNLMYLNFKPDTSEWQVKRSFNCSIELDDSDGVGIDTGAIYYRISTRGLTGYGSWLTVSDIEQLENGRIKAVVDIRDDFAEGTENYIKFKASDLAGNTRETGNYNIKLDFSAIEYQSEEPAYHSKQTNGVVSYTITIADVVSEVDPDTVEYRLSLNGVNGYGDWTTENMYPILVAGEEIYGMRFRADLELQPGKSNYIRWRAKDIAGNGYTESTDYMIWVNSEPKPAISSPSPDAEYKSGKAITFSALGTSDNDNDTLTYKWRSSIDGEFGFIKELSVSTANSDLLKNSRGISCPREPTR
jgi:hypothetical protein